MFTYREKKIDLPVLRFKRKEELSDGTSNNKNREPTVIEVGSLCR